MVRFLKRPRNLALLIAPIIGFILLHILLERIGFHPLPVLPIVAMVSTYFYAYYLTMWLKNR